MRLEFHSYGTMWGMARVPHPRIGRVIPRHAQVRVLEALQDTRIVLVNGARQGGKSTLVAQIGNDVGAEWYSLDDYDTRQAVQLDPTGFVRRAPRMVVDEIQRLPELLLSIKSIVDAEPTPGRFLLTGSARVLGLRTLPDTLVGRMETIELWPLAQGEIDNKPDGFVDAAFTHGVDVRHTSDLQRNDYISRIARGGFPEAIARTPRRRTEFLRSYVADMINRDVVQLMQIERGREMRQLVDLVAARSGNLIVPGTLAGELGIAKTTVERYLRLLEEVFLIKRIPAWSRNMTTRTISTAKVAMVDSGVATEMLGEDESSLRRLTSPLGGLLEGFVAMEIARQLTWSETWAQLYHYRTKDKVEVDIVLENRRKQVVAIEVKASATVGGNDFRGLTHLADHLGDDLIAGYVLYLGEQDYTFGPKFRALPVSALWEVTQ